MRHAHIVRFVGKRGSQLGPKSHPDPGSIGSEVCEGPIVMPLSAPETTSVRGEGEAGTETNVNIPDLNRRMPGRIRFADSEGPTLHLGRNPHRAEFETGGDDPGIDETAELQPLGEGAQVHLRSERGVSRDLVRNRLAAEPVDEVFHDALAPRRTLGGTQIIQDLAIPAATRLLFLGYWGICHLRIVRGAGTIGQIPMRKQATAFLLLSLASLAPAPGQENEEKFQYKPPVVEKLLFDDAISMFDQERKEYATNLAIYAANQVTAKKASQEALESARRILALALHLDRRNRQALVLNFQLKQGVIPEVKKGDYNPRTFSRLLLSRAKLLIRQDNEREKLLARCFVELSALIDPRNEDAVFMYENQRIDSGEVDWRVITDSVKDKPSRAPEK